MAARKDAFSKLNEALATTLKLTQQRGEEFAKDFLHASEVQREQIREILEDLAKRSKKNAEFLTEAVQNEVLKQIRAHNLMSKDEVQKLVEKLVEAALAKMGRHPEAREPSHAGGEAHSEEPSDSSSHASSPNSTSTKAPTEPTEPSTSSTTDEPPKKPRSSTTRRPSTPRAPRGTATPKPPQES